MEPSSLGINVSEKPGRSVPPAKLGSIRNGHHIKLSNLGEGSPWDQSFERVFDAADSRFPDLLDWLMTLDCRPVRHVKELRQRFIPQASSDEQLRWLTEFAVSLAVRSPLNREMSVMLAEEFRGPLPEAERNPLIGLNMKDSQRVIADSIGADAKFVAVFSLAREFVFGDGFFHNVANVRMRPHNPKIFVPITPHLSILVCQPMQYMVEPKLHTLLLDDHEVDVCNDTVQVYARKAIFFREQQPEIRESFRSARHLRYDHPGNPIDTLIHSIPGVPPRNTSLDWLHDKEGGR